MLKSAIIGDMKAEIINAHSQDFETAILVADRLRSGAVAVLPTDTVYGIGVAVAERATPERLYEIKGRDGDKAIACLIAEPGDLSVYGADVSDYARQLARFHWPGALTLVVKASERIPEAFRARDGSIALRVPAHPLTLAILKRLGMPLATSSANLQGCPPALEAVTLDSRLTAGVDLIVDAGAAPGGVASTIVSCLGGRPHIIREGAIPATDIPVD